MVFGAVVLGLIALVVVAVIRMSRKKAAGSADSDEPQTAEPAERGDEEPVEPGEGAAEGEARGEEEPAQEPEEAPKPEDQRAAKASHQAAAAAEKHEKQKNRSKADHAAETQRLAQGLAKTRGGFIAKLGNLFRGRAELDPEMLDQVEEILFTADIGVNTSHELIEELRQGLGKHELQNPEAVWRHIRQRSAKILEQSTGAELDVSRSKPFVVLVVGVNGTGKTTTIGKLAAQLRDEGRSVVLAAGDTFRAAAAEQLQIWGQRASAEVVRGKEGADPSSVIIDALKKAQEVNADVVIADTAGRLHTKLDLMEEIQKVRRSIGKRIEGAPHETLLVLDATTGQNAIAQARMFKEAVDITGIILTKLDGTAKGGVVLGICNELKLPVRYIGIGERAEDLRAFDPEAFVEALYEEASARA